MLSDEEKKAIEKIKKILYMFPESEELKLLLNLIEKQQKEIEELKEQAKRRWVYIKKNGEVEPLFYISKDKIKAKIEEFKIVRDTIIENEKKLNIPMMTYDLKRNDYCIKMLQSLLEKEFPTTITKEDLEKRWEN